MSAIQASTEAVSVHFAARQAAAHGSGRSCSRALSQALLERAGLLALLGSPRMDALRPSELLRAVEGCAPRHA